MDSRIIVLTGAFGSGKTTLCTQLISLLRQSGTDIAGIVSPPEFENETKVGIHIQNIRTREERLLAKYVSRDQGTANLHWRFDIASMEWGTEILRTATPCQVLIIDELGPLELVHGDGWHIAFAVLKARNYHTALVVVRPSLIPHFREQVKGFPIAVITVTPTTRVLIRNTLIRALAVANEHSDLESSSST